MVGELKTRGDWPKGSQKKEAYHENSQRRILGLAHSNRAQIEGSTERATERISWVKNVKPLVPSTAGAHTSQPSAAAHNIRAQELRHVGVLLRAAV